MVELIRKREERWLARSSGVWHVNKIYAEESISGDGRWPRMKCQECVRVNG
jgi:hypothetical protein